MMSDVVYLFFILYLHYPVLWKTLIALSYETDLLMSYAMCVCSVYLLKRTLNPACVLQVCSSFPTNIVDGIQMCLDTVRTQLLSTRSSQM